ncbi:AI-2E family transporter [Arenicella sp. 4NH20-0111]|uniref:AI-2E family transporter n=1 Tax=Arenicella sp. 4NH20-0111 TaxID=3127648 RepID=UPI0031042F28
MKLDTRAISISLVILATIGVFYVLVVGKAFLVPLAVALMIWYVINAMSRTYTKIIPWVKEPNWLTMLLSIISIGIFIAFAIDMVQNNVANVQNSIPRYRDNFANLSTKVNALIPAQIFDRLPKVSDLVQGIEIAPLLTGFTDIVVAMIGNITLVLIYVAFMLAEQGTFRKKIKEIFPDQAKRGSVMSILVHVQEDIQTYLWIKSLTSTITGLISYFVLKMVGVDFAVFWAFSIFLLNFIPTIGSIIATLFPAMLALIQFDTFFPFFVVLIGVGAIQVVVGNVLEPKLMGNSLNVSPFVVMMSLTLWGSIWGIAGMFLSVPITVMMLIVFAHFERTRYIAVLLSGDGSLKFAKHTKAQLEKIAH